jgi:WD40 repeat protein
VCVVIDVRLPSQLNCTTPARPQDLESKNLVDTLTVETPALGPVPVAISLAWSADGQTLFVGYTDNKIRVFQVSA